MEYFQTRDKVNIAYIDTEAHPSTRSGKEALILLHGFTGSSAVYQRNFPALSRTYRVIAPDLRGHGASGKCAHGYHVSRLAMDLRELMAWLGFVDGGPGVRIIGGSLGCSILWCYAELFTTSPFTHMIFVDQSPLQNSTLDGWDSRFCNRGMNSAPAVAALQTTLSLAPERAHLGTIAACLSYRSHPLPTDTTTAETHAWDEKFFLEEAMIGDAKWYGKLMADHTALDWRDSISANFGPGSGSTTRVLVVASSRSGCFPAAGPMSVVGLVNGVGGWSADFDGDGEEVEEEEKEKRAKGVVVDWGGHWCYWEDAEKFNTLCLEFLGKLE